MARRASASKGWCALWGWLKPAAFVFCLLLVYYTSLLIWSLPELHQHSDFSKGLSQETQRLPSSALRASSGVVPEERAEPDRHLLQRGGLTAHLAWTPGKRPGLQDLQWSQGDRSRWQLDLHSLQPTFAAVVLQGSKLATPCTASRSDELDCGGVAATWHMQAEDLASAQGAVLRWQLRFSKPVLEARVSMWLPGAAVEGGVDGSPVTVRQRPLVSVLSLHCHATASSSTPGRSPERMVDDDVETEWFAAKGASTAWVQLDLGSEQSVRTVQWKWWAKSMADEWKLESKGDGKAEGWNLRSSSSSLAAPQEKFNAEVKIPGWSAKTRFVRLSMSKGNEDPWGFGVLFGIRSFEVLGPDEAATGAAELWGEASGAHGAPGAWLALEHPRAHCSISGKGAPKQAGSEAVWRLSTCSLRWSDTFSNTVEVSGSFGVFEDGQHSQLRRVFATYLQKARDRPFSQTLHYNSWYDLRSAPCTEGSNAESSKGPCYSHRMTEASCLERIEAFNSNLTAHGGPPLDAFLLDDGWDNWDSLWEVDSKSFPSGFKPLLDSAAHWGTRLGVWMSPFGGYGMAGSRRLRYGVNHGFERNQRGSFALAGPKYFATFRDIVERRIREGFGLFKFDGLGGGLGQSGGEQFMDDFEAMLSLIRGVRQQETAQSKKVWISLTIGTWPSPFWLLWGDSIWRDGPDVGEEGVGSKRERWLTFRDAALRRALKRGPLFPMSAFMQHGIVWSRSAETSDMWPSRRHDELQDFCNEVLSFFLSGTGLQELYIQLELMTPRHWKVLAAVAAFARKEEMLLHDVHPIGGMNPARGEAYGAAAFGDTSNDREAQGIFWWRNPAENPQDAAFTIAEIFELPDRFIQDGQCWQLKPLQIPGATECGPDLAPQTLPVGFLRSTAPLQARLEAFDVHAWQAFSKRC